MLFWRETMKETKKSLCHIMSLNMKGKQRILLLCWLLVNKGKEGEPSTWQVFMIIIDTWDDLFQI